MSYVSVHSEQHPLELSINKQMLLFSSSNYQHREQILTSVSNTQTFVFFFLLCFEIIQEWNFFRFSNLPDIECFDIYTFLTFQNRWDEINLSKQEIRHVSDPNMITQLDAQFPNSRRSFSLFLCSGYDRFCFFVIRKAFAFLASLFLHR